MVKKQIGCSKIKPTHFFSNQSEKTKFNWFAFELACQIDCAVPAKLKRYLVKHGYPQGIFNSSCIKLAILLQKIVLRKLKGEIPEMQLNYTEIEMSFPDLNDKTINELLHCTATAWDELLGICGTCPAACISNKDDYCDKFDDKFYYE